METTLSKTVWAFAAIACLSVNVYSQTVSGTGLLYFDANDSTKQDVIFTDTEIRFTTGVAGSSGSGTFTRLFTFKDGVTETKGTGDGNSTAEAYNYDGTRGKSVFDNPGPSNNFPGHLEVADLAVATIGGAKYIQFVLDATGTKTLLDFRVYVQRESIHGTTPKLVETEALLNASSSAVGTDSALGTLLYTFNTWDNPTDVNNSLNMTMSTIGGSGQADVSFNVPLRYFSNAGLETTDNIYVWVKTTDTQGSASMEFASPNKTGIPTYSTLVPEPATVGGGLVMVALAGSGMIRRRHRQMQRGIE